MSTMFDYNSVYKISCLQFHCWCVSLTNVYYQFNCCILKRRLRRVSGVLSTRWILKTACIFVEFCTSALFVGWQRESNDGSHHPGRPTAPRVSADRIFHLSPLMRMTKLGWRLSLEACNPTLIQRNVVSYFEWSDAERPTPLISCCTCNAAIPGILLYLF